MNKYEIMFILDNGLSDDNKAKIIDKFIQVVEKMDGKIVNLDKWGTKKLAYEINRKTEGYYFLMYVEAPATVPMEVERLVGITEGVVRFLIIKRDEFNFKKVKRKVDEVPSVKEEVAADVKDADVKAADDKVADDKVAVDKVDESTKAEAKAATDEVVDKDAEYGSPVVDGVDPEFSAVTDDIDNTADASKE